jgi:hypothetical protein
MPITKLAVSTRNKMAQQIIDDLDSGSGPSILVFYTGAQPAGPDTAVTDQVKLGTLICSDPSATKANGVITFSAITQDDAADNGGTATWCRHLNSDNAAVADHDVTNVAGTGAVKLSNVLIVAGKPISMQTLTITIGGG